MAIIEVLQEDEPLSDLIDGLTPAEYYIKVMTARAEGILTDTSMDEEPEEAQQGAFNLLPLTLGTLFVSRPQKPHDVSRAITAEPEIDMSELPKLEEAAKCLDNNLYTYEWFNAKLSLLRFNLMRAKRKQKVDHDQLIGLVDELSNGVEYIFSGADTDEIAQNEENKQLKEQ